MGIQVEVVNWWDSGEYTRKTFRASDPQSFGQMKLHKIFMWSFVHYCLLSACSGTLGDFQHADIWEGNSRVQAVQVLLDFSQTWKPRSAVSLET